ncbi:MAG TPA: type II toxin-antitoxin system HicA family toxin, partial [Terriglobales bacterium]|nr:type II toxin-antitoxin system HicA family toxin [Terriglobales bacterium]
MAKNANVVGTQLRKASSNGHHMKFRDLVKAIEKEGWKQIRQSGSHRQFAHPAKPGIVTIAGHPGKDVPPGTLNSI